MPTTQEIINIAKVSQYLCENDIAKKGLSGGGIDLQLPSKIYNIRKNVEWLNGLDSNDIVCEWIKNNNIIVKEIING